MKLPAKPPSKREQLPALLSESQSLLETVRTMPLPEGRGGTRFLDGARVLKEVAALIESRMKGLLAESPDCVPHWHLFPGASVREITATGTKLRQALGEELSEDPFIDAGKWSFSALETAYMDEHCVDRVTGGFSDWPVIGASRCSRHQTKRSITETNMITQAKNKPEESARALDNGLSPSPNGNFELRTERFQAQPPSVTKVSYPSIRQTRYGGFVITQGTITRTFFKRTAGLQAIAFYQMLLARQLEREP